MHQLVKGIGNDIIEVERIQGSIDRFGVSFLNKIFTKNEIRYCQSFTDSARHFAGRFAGKEAVAKALKCGISKDLGWLDIEILSEKGPPECLLSSSACKTFNNPNIFVSISHCRSYATAFCIVL